jgi:prepilin-type N-terminal cleavage/methylation domain-containing protein
MKNSRIQAFTLVELSIVLVIIGLIVGGVVGGQSLIKSAKLNKAITEVSSIKTALGAFELQYDALPGDMTDAYDYWGVATGCTDVDSGTSPYTGCNGNGNNRIDLREDRRAWQHLSLAGIIPGNYTGLWTGGASALGATSIAEFNATIPTSATGGYYSLLYVTTDNTLTLSGISGTAPSLSHYGSLLTPPDAKTIDKKMDDGIYNTGKVNGGNGSGTIDCIASGCYNLTISAVSCQILFYGLK